MLVFQLVLAVVFGVAGISKIFDRTGTRDAIVGFGVRPRLATAIAPLLPIAELAIAVALIPASSARWAALAATLLLLGFAGGMASALARGRTPDCSCFGNLQSAPVSKRALARNLALTAVAGFVALHRPETGGGDWVIPRTGAALLAVCSIVAVSSLAALTLRLRDENQRLRRHTVSTDGPVPVIRPVPPAVLANLPVGAPAPEFDLKRLDAETETLASLRGEGRPVVLVFVDPSCGPCHELVSHVARWQATLSNTLPVAVVSIGSPEQISAVWDGYPATVLVDSDSQVTNAYQVRAWPSALAIGSDGNIASELAGSRDAMEVLVRAMLERVKAPTPPMQSAA